MAFRRRRGMRRKSWVSRHEHLWTAAQANQTALVSAASLVFPVVAKADWDVRAGYSTATLVRVRGQIACVQTAAGAGCVFGYAAVLDEDEALPDAATAATYIDEDILATYCYPMSGLPGEARIDVDIKVRRKLRLQDRVILVFRATGVDFEISGIVRALIVVK